MSQAQQSRKKQIQWHQPEKNEVMIPKLKVGNISHEEIYLS